MVSSNKSINGDSKTWSELVSLGLSMISLCMVGKNNAGTEKYSEEELVMRLVKEIPRNQNFQIYFDNWFSTFRLLIRLCEMGILATVTFGSNRIGGCPFICDKDSKSNGSGTFGFPINLNSFLRLIKWYYNKVVILGSIFSSVQSTLDKQHWDAKKKEYCRIKYPDMEKDCNQSIGGVEVNDKMLYLYCIDIHLRRQWYLEIITHLLNICNVDGWDLYRRNSDQLHI